MLPPTTTSFAPGHVGPKRRGWLLLAVLAYVAELFFFTKWRGTFGFYWSPVAFISSSRLRSKWPTG
jgi:hypothetical protein